MSTDEVTEYPEDQIACIWGSVISALICLLAAVTADVFTPANFGG
jgi:hypothetical protein